MKKSSLLITAIAAVFSTALHGQTIVFSDNFETSQGATFTTSGVIGTSAWDVSRSGVDFGARIDNGILELTNTASAATNAAGWVFASRAISSTGNFNTTLSSSAGLVTWTLNMRQIRANPSGFDTTITYGVAYVLAGTGSISRITGSGWAIVLGDSTAGDAIRLANFTNGISGFTNVITAPAPLNDVGAEYLSLRVTYDPSNNLWSLLGRNDGPTAFADPNSGTLSSLGTATNSTFVNTSLGVTGAYWQGNNALNQTAFFDNISLTAVPEPGTFLLFGLGVAAVIIRRKMLKTN